MNGNQIGRRSRVAATTIVGAVASALLASLCCIGPLVFALLGIGGAGLLVEFEPLRPIFTVATAGLLGAGFYLTYRKPKVAAVESGAACDCALPRVNKSGKIMLWIATFLVVSVWVFPYLAPVLFG